MPAVSLVLAFALGLGDPMTESLSWCKHGVSLSGLVQRGSHIICMVDGGEFPLHLEGPYMREIFLEQACVSMSTTEEPRPSGHLQFSLMQDEKSIGHSVHPGSSLYGGAFVNLPFPVVSGAR